MPNSYSEIYGKRNLGDVVKFGIFEMGELPWIIPESPNRHHTEKTVVRRRHQGLDHEELVAMGRNQTQSKREKICRSGFEDGGRGYKPRKENIIASDFRKGLETACF